MYMSANTLRMFKLFIILSTRAEIQKSLSLTSGCWKFSAFKFIKWVRNDKNPRRCMRKMIMIILLVTLCLHFQHYERASGRNLPLRVRLMPTLNLSCMRSKMMSWEGNFLISQFDMQRNILIFNFLANICLSISSHIDLVSHTTQGKKDNWKIKFKSEENCIA
jgi:hypothetical protein